MKKNMGAIDRILRILSAAAIAGLYFTGKLSGLAAIILGIIAVVILLTSVVGFCPLYTLLGIKTTRNK
jgi:hypothetical protein